MDLRATLNARRQRNRTVQQDQGHATSPVVVTVTLNGARSASAAQLSSKSRRRAQQSGSEPADVIQDRIDAVSATFHPEHDKEASQSMVTPEQKRRLADYRRRLHISSEISSAQGLSHDSNERSAPCRGEKEIFVSSMQAESGQKRRQEDLSAETMAPEPKIPRRDIPESFSDSRIAPEAARNFTPRNLSGHEVAQSAANHMPPVGKVATNHLHERPCSPSPRLNVYAQQKVQSNNSPRRADVYRQKRSQSPLGTLRQEPRAYERRSVSPHALRPSAVPFGLNTMRDQRPTYHHDARGRRSRSRSRDASGWRQQDQRQRRSRSPVGPVASEWHRPPNTRDLRELRSRSPPHSYAAASHHRRHLSPPKGSGGDSRRDSDWDRNPRRSTEKDAYGNGKGPRNFVRRSDEPRYEQRNSERGYERVKYPVSGRPRDISRENDVGRETNHAERERIPAGVVSSMTQPLHERGNGGGGGGGGGGGFREPDFGRGGGRYGDTSSDKRREASGDRTAELQRRDAVSPMARRGASPVRASSQLRRDLSPQRDPDFSRSDVDIGIAIEQHPRAESILALLKTQGERMSLGHVSRILRGLSTHSDGSRGSTKLDQILEKLLEISNRLRFEFDLDFCREAMTSLLKLKTKTPARSFMWDVIYRHMSNALDQCNGTDVSNLFRAMADLHTEGASLELHALCARGKELVSEYKIQEISDILLSVAKLKMYESCKDLIQVFSVQVEHLVCANDDSMTLEPEILSSIMWAFGTLRVVSPHVIDRLLSKLEHIQGWKARHVATILWSMGMLNLSAHQLGFNYLSQQVSYLGLWKEYTAQHVAHTFWAFASLQKVPDPGLVKVLTQRAIEIMRRFSSEELGNLFWALATLKDKCPPSLRLVTKMCEHAADLDIEIEQHVSGILWSIAVLNQDSHRLPCKMQPEAIKLLLRVVSKLPKLARNASPQFLAHTLHSMASVHIWNPGDEEDDTTFVRRSCEESAPDLRRDKQRLDKEKADVFAAFSPRILEVVSELNGSTMSALLWAIRTLQLDSSADFLAALSRQALAIKQQEVSVVDLMWTHAVLWKIPDPGLLADFHQQAMATAEQISLVNVTRLLWSLAVMYVQKAHGGSDWRSVLNKLARVILQNEDKLAPANLKQLHQFFLTCNTCVDLVDALPEAMFEVKAALEDRCCRHVTEASASRRLEHSLGECCAAQLRKLGLQCTTEEECPNTGYNLDVRITATPPGLEAPPISGHRGWIVEVDRPCHYLSGSRGHKEGRCKLREAHLEGVGYSVIVVPYWEWADLLQRPDSELQSYLAHTVQSAFANAQRKFE